MSTEKVAQLTFQTTDFSSACIVCLCGSKHVCVFVCVWRGAPVIMSCCFSMEQLCEPPAASKQGTDCLATVLSLANFPPPPTNRAGHMSRKRTGGEKHNTEKERTERLVRKFAVKKHEKSWRDISSCFQQRVIRRRKQNDSTY